MAAYHTAPAGDPPDDPAGALPDLLGAAGLWKPLPDSNWGKWSAAIPRHLSPRGTAGLVMRTADDKIVDLCRPDPPHVVGG